MRHPLIALLFVFLAAGATSDPGSASTEAAAPPPSSCAPIAGLDPLLAPGTILLIGEVHGTREFPAAVADIVCRAAELSRSVTVELELDSRWDAAFDRFLAGPEVEPALAKLLVETDWAKFPSPFPADGRTSQAMVELMRRLHRLRKSGARLVVRGFDGWIALPEAERRRNRDAVMTETLVKSLEASPADLTVLLTGNLHSRKRANSVSFLAEPMAYLVARARPQWKLVSLLGTHAAGEAWICTPDGGCGARPQPSRTPAGPRQVALGAEIETPFGKAGELGYDGTIFVGPLTASPPVAPPG